MRSDFFDWYTNKMKTNNRFILLATCIAAFGGILFGYDTAVISGAIPGIRSYFSLNEYYLGWAVSSILVGCAIGAAVAGIVADKYGRRIGLMACAIFFAVSGVGAGLSDSLTGFILFRMIGGLGVGASAMLSPMYIAEMALPKWRGRLVAVYQLAIVFGILVAYFANFIFESWGHNSWRWMLASQTVPSILFLSLLFLVPETPRWLIMKRRNTAARKVLEKMKGDENVEHEMMVIEKSFQGTTGSWKQLCNRKYRSVIVVGILIAVFLQVTGINAILYYAPVIFKETGLDNTTSLMQTIGIGGINMAATFVAIGLVDRVGRRALFLYGLVLMGISLFVVGFCFQAGYFDHYIVLIFMLLYVAAFGSTLGAVGWVYLSEIFPNAIRSRALALATLVLWIADFVVTLTFPILTRHVGTSCTLFCYAALCAVAFVYMLLKLKETKGRSLEEIETFF